MKKILVLAAMLAAIACGSAEASLVISTLNTKVDYGFSGFTAPTGTANWSNFDGSDGALNWNTFAWASGSRTGTAAQFGVASGVNGQGVPGSGFPGTTGGVYAVDIGGVRAFAIRQNGSMDAGSLTVRVNNGTSATLTELTIDFEAYIRNDQPRSMEYRFYTSGDNVSYTRINNADGNFQFVSDPAAGTSPPWDFAPTNFQSITLTGLNIAAGSDYFLRWGVGSTGPGTGARDAWALRSFSITAVPEPSALLLVGTVLGAGFLRRRRS